MLRLQCSIHLPGMTQVMANCVFLLSKYSYYASFQTNAEVWVATEELEGVGKSVCGGE